MISSTDIYLQFPYFLKVIAASVKGHNLQNFRYGKEIERLVEEAINRESWSAEQWDNWRLNRLEYILTRAATRVPYYRDYWQQQRRSGNQADWSTLSNWPILMKEQVREKPLAFVADDCNPRRMYIDHTSGTTGTPLKIYQSKKSVRYWYALFEARWRRWYGVTNHDNWAIFGGRLVADFQQIHPPYWVWNVGMHQLYCSSYHINENSVADYIDAIEKHDVQYILGYPSTMYSIAAIALRLGLKPPRVRFLLSNAEPLYLHQKEKMQVFFQAPIYDTYGMAETLCAASECEHGYMHMWPETGVFEVLDDTGSQVHTGQVGRLISTGLINADMPLIRYDVGDNVAIGNEPWLCKCGRSMPRLLEILGRHDDMIQTKDGRMVGRLDPIFKQGFHISEAQIIQESLEFFRIRYVPSEEFSYGDLEGIRSSLFQRVGPVGIEFEKVNAIPRTTAGKFQAVISKVKQ